MTFEYTGRHIEVTPAIRSHVEDHFSKLKHIFNGSHFNAHIILAVEKNRQTGEVIVHWRDHMLAAKDTNADMYMALTRAVAKVEKQALKLKNKTTDRKHSAAKTSVAAAKGGRQLQATPPPVRIISARRYNIKPMTAEEAALELTSRPDHFLVFRDADTDRVGVLYKRQDGNFGLIEP